MSTLKEIVNRSREATAGGAREKVSHTGLTREKVSAAISQAYDRGAADARQQEEETQRRLAHFEGQVMAHAMAAKLMHAKVSMANNLCWDCGERSFDSEDPHRRCATCAVNHP